MLEDSHPWQKTRHRTLLWHSPPGTGASSPRDSIGLAHRSTWEAVPSSSWRLKRLFLKYLNDNFTAYKCPVKWETLDVKVCNKKKNLPICDLVLINRLLCGALRKYIRNVYREKMNKKNENCNSPGNPSNPDSRPFYLLVW